MMPVEQKEPSEHLLPVQVEPSVHGITPMPFEQKEPSEH